MRRVTDMARSLCKAAAKTRRRVRPSLLGGGALRHRVPRCHFNWQGPDAPHAGERAPGDLPCQLRIAEVLGHHMNALFDLHLGEVLSEAHMRATPEGDVTVLRIAFPIRV